MCNWCKCIHDQFTSMLNASKNEAVSHVHSSFDNVDVM